MTNNAQTPPADSVNAYGVDWNRILTSFEFGNDASAKRPPTGPAPSPQEVIARLNNDIACIQNDPLVQRIAALVGGNPAYDACYAPYREKIEGMTAMRDDVNKAIDEAKARDQQIASGKNNHLPNLKNGGGREV